jgi:hypothetical protein
MWQGWFGRHGGQLEFLGDHLGGSSGSYGAVANAVTAVLLLLFVGLAGRVFRHTT